MITIENICKKTQEELFEYIVNFSPVKDEYKKYKKRNWILIKGNYPILLVSHLDTVHRDKVKDICYSEDRNIIISPQGIGGDDRCGVYAMLKIWYDLSQQNIFPNLLFCCDEEIGCYGADDFCLSEECFSLSSKVNLVIEIDRKGNNEAVYYDCDNKDFEKYINSKGFESKKGSFTDICVICPELGVAGVNLSGGYYNAHSEHEYINIQELNNTIEKVKEIVKESPTLPKYDYIEYQYWEDNYMYEDDYSYKYKGRYSSNDYLYSDIYYNMPEKYIEVYGFLIDYYSEDKLLEAIANKGYEVLLDLYDDIEKIWKEDNYGDKKVL